MAQLRPSKRARARMLTTPVAAYCRSRGATRRLVEYVRFVREAGDAQPDQRRTRATRLPRPVTTRGGMPADARHVLTAPAGHTLLAATVVSMRKLRGTSSSGFEWGLGGQ
jgi:hypothetical protein